MKKAVLITVVFLMINTNFISAQSSSSYGEGVDVKPSLLEQEIIDWLIRVRQQNSLESLKINTGAIGSSRDYAQSFNRDNFKVEKDKLQQKLWEYGVSDAQYRPYGIISGGKSVKRFLIDLKTGIAKQLANEILSKKNTDVGVGIYETEDSFKACVVILKKFVDVGIFPKQLKLNTAKNFTGNLFPGFSKPQIFVTTPSGTVITPAVQKEGEYFNADLKFSTSKGRYTVELMVSDSLGPVVANIFPIFIDVPVSNEFIVDTSVSSDMTPENMEDKMFELLNQDRAKASLLPLQKNETLALVARGHAKDMSDNNYFAHISPIKGTLKDRIAPYKIPYLRIAENIVKNTDVFKAQVKLMESPAHRMTVLDPDVTHVGVGVVKSKSDDKNYYFVQNYAKLPVVLSASEVQSRLYYKINSLRQKENLPAFDGSDTLQKTAEKFSQVMKEKNTLAVTFSDASLVDMIKQNVENLKGVGANIFKTKNIEDIVNSEINKDPQFTHIGLGVVESNFTGEFWITVIWGRF